MNGSYQIPRTNNNTLIFNIGGIDGNGVFFEYNQVAGTIIPLIVVCRLQNALTSQPQPKTAPGNYTTFSQYEQAEFEYFTLPQQDGPYTLPNPAINLVISPTPNTFQYRVPLEFQYISNKTRIFVVEFKLMGDGESGSSNIFYLYKNGVEITRTFSSQNKERLFILNSIVELSTNDTIEIRMSMSNSNVSTVSYSMIHFNLTEIKS